MGRWEIVCLEEICLLKAGKFVSASDIKDTWIDDLYPCYGGNGLRGYVSTYTHNGEYSLIGRQGALCGNVQYVQGKFHATEHAVVVQPKVPICNRWLYFVLKNLNLNQYSTGAAQPGLNINILNLIRISLPPLPIQQKIADALDKASALIEMRKAQIEKLDLLIKSQFVEMFGDPVTNPMGWDRKVLTEICDQILGGGTPSKSNAEFFEGTIPWVSPKDMKTAIIRDSIDHITDDAIKKSSTKLVPRNSVLLVIRSGILKRHLPVAINFVPVTMNQDMKALIPNRLVTPQYLMYYLRLIEADILGGVRAVTADNIDFDHFKQRKIIVPPILLQNKFSKLVLKVEEQRRILGESLDELEQYSNSLMQKCFSGEMFT